MPLPADISDEIKSGNQKEKLDVNIQTVAVPKEIMSEPDMWMPQLFNKIEKAFAPKLGYENQNKLAVTLPLVREIRGDYKSEKLMVSIIAVDVSPVIKEEAYKKRKVKTDAPVQQISEKKEEKQYNPYLAELERSHK